MLARNSKFTDPEPDLIAGKRRSARRAGRAGCSWVSIEAKAGIGSASVSFPSARDASRRRSGRRPWPPGWRKLLLIDSLRERRPDIADRVGRGARRVRGQGRFNDRSLARRAIAPKKPISRTLTGSATTRDRRPVDGRRDRQRAGRPCRPPSGRTRGPSQRPSIACVRRSIRPASPSSDSSDHDRASLRVGRGRERRAGRQDAPESVSQKQVVDDGRDSELGRSAPAKLATVPSGLDVAAGRDARPGGSRRGFPWSSPPGRRWRSWRRGASTLALIGTSQLRSDVAGFWSLGIRGSRSLPPRFSRGGRGAGEPVGASS